MNTEFARSVDGVQIAYDVVGHGPRLMLLHGVGKDRRDWHKLGYVERLKGDFTVVSVDLRGTGASGFSTEIGDYAVEKLCADVTAVADACDAQRYSVWGYSFGGNLARYLGARSERVSAVAIVGVPFGPAVDAEFDRFVDDFIRKWGKMAKNYRPPSGDAPPPKSTLKARMPGWVACFEAMRSWPPVSPGELRCPALLLAGTRNTGAFRWIESNRHALEAAKVQIEVVEGLNHPEEFSQVERVFPRVASFLKTHAAVA
jgi:pimeloyl-ACP methyl ester carboxylesterase